MYVQVRRGGRLIARHGVAVLVTATVALGGGAGCTTDETTSSSEDTATTLGVPTTAAGTEATGTPVKIGFTSGGEGATAIPEIIEGARLAVDHINKHENGIGGHPIELNVCPTDGTPESSAACANRLVADQVVAVVDGTDLGTDAKIPILRDAGIAMLGAGTLGTGQSLNPDVFFFAPPATTFPQAQVDLAAQVGAKHLTLVFPDVPQVPILTDLSKTQAELNGIALDVVKFDQAAPDFDAAIAAVMANGSDAIATIATDEWCTGLIRAARAAEFAGSINAGACVEYAVELSPEDAEGIYGIAASWGPRSKESAPPEADAVIDRYVAAMSATEREDEVIGLSFTGWTVIWQVSEMLRSIDDLSAQGIMAGMRALNGVPSSLGQTITCGPRPYPGFSGCAEGWMFFQNQGDGTSKPLTGEFVRPKS